MKEIVFYIMTALIFLAPYRYLEQDNVNSLLFGLITVAAMFILNKVRGNKKYSSVIFIMTVISIGSLKITSFTIDSLQGLSLYLSALLLYFIFVNYKEKEEIILKIITYLMAANCIFYIVIQGAFYNGGILEGRIDGNIGYANTYALLMLISLYFNRIRKKDFFKEILDVLFIEGILLTGSRNTLLYLLIFVIIDIVYKRKKDNVLNLNILFNCFTAEFLYLITSKLRLGAVLIIPIILIIYYFLVNEEHIKLINIISFMALPLGGILLFFSGSNLALRIASASTNSNEFQLRIGYLEDVIRYVMKNPFGGGLNTYMYNQGTFQTGYYDVRYVHNSFGQAFYDMGFLGLVFFTALFILGIILIVKGNHKNKFYYLSLYSTIYLHSLLDFDFSYLVVIAVVVMIVAFTCNINIEISKSINLYKVIYLCVGVYIFFITSMYCIGKYELKKGNLNEVVSIGRFLDNITVGDNACKELEFDGLRYLCYETKNLDYLKSGVEILEKVEGQYNRKSYIYSKLAAAYEELGDIEKSSLYYEKNLEIQKYVIYHYNAYCDMLTRVEKTTGISYEEKKNEIMNRYYTLENSRSEKSKKRFS